MKQYTRDFLLSFAEKQNCRRLPDDLDPALSRESPSADIVVDGGGGGGGAGGKFVNRQEHELPEWRNRASANGGLLTQQVHTRRKNQDEEGYAARGPSSWGEGNQLRSKPGMQGPNRWDHRSSERDRGGRGANWDGGAEQGDRHRAGWNGSEHDGLLGSGGGLRGAYPGGRGSDRYNGGGRGARNQDSRLNKSSGGYRNDFDSIDGETFGEKNLNNDRADEERRRREEFESMRKEQQRMKELKKQEKLDKANVAHELADEKLLSISETKQDVSLTPRPLVPPGFSPPVAKSAVKNGHHQAREAATNEEQTSVADNKPKVQENSQAIDAVDPVAIACSVSEGVVLSENSKVSVMDKLFSKASSGATVPFSSPQPEAKADGRMSKFAHLFSFEDDLFKSSPNQAGGNTPQPSAPTSSDVKLSSEGGLKLPMPAGPSLEDIEKSLDREAKNFSNTNAAPPPFAQKLGKPVLTCEDIEQSLLAEVKYDTPASTEWSRENNSSWKHEPDSHASRHLLSLLQKPSLRSDKSDNEQKGVVEEQACQMKQVSQGVTDNGVATLEALFGRSFMMELRSTDAPLSAKAVSEASSSSLVRKGDAIAAKLNAGDSKLSEGQPLDNNHQRWASLWSNNSNKPENRQQSMSFDEIRSSSATGVERSYQEIGSKSRSRRGFDSGTPTDQASLEDGGGGGTEFSGIRNQSREELDSGVLNDFLKFKKAMKHRNKVNDSFLGMIDDAKENPSVSDVEAAAATSVSAPTALYRSHSPPLINQRSSTIQLQQLKHAFASQGGPKVVKQQQLQHNILMGNGNLAADGRYGRTSQGRSSTFARQQQQQALFEQAHGHFATQQQGYPQQYSSKQRSQVPGGYYPPNGLNQPVTNLHQAAAAAHIPQMSYGHHHPPFVPGLVGGGYHLDQAFVSGGDAGDSQAVMDNRWIGRDGHHVVAPGGVPGGVYQHPMYGGVKFP